MHAPGLSSADDDAELTTSLLWQVQRSATSAQECMVRNGTSRAGTECTQLLDRIRSCMRHRSQTGYGVAMNINAVTKQPGHACKLAPHGGGTRGAMQI